ncbi:uncharacterized protein M421DRAFT_419640 [Didymella exigua CBS 183.55]|uniref:Uncharacterized protein n=1 Tax=Didymella exigua CBS 183.55 TaxID=1150837 RepID=A0A6A5RS37_9PLEO|nr:uncharacterized protein M421DRAFT_419640 [Didymella exigua CBS 183.55]KAF1929874.1 hypothetical protein M421DRAFT_419640 [Didymella exigua CBS 183.55]
MIQNKRLSKYFTADFERLSQQRKTLVSLGRSQGVLTVIQLLLSAVCYKGSLLASRFSNSSVRTAPHHLLFSPSLFSTICALPGLSVTTSGRHCFQSKARRWLRPTPT